MKICPFILLALSSITMISMQTAGQTIYNLGGKKCLLIQTIIKPGAITFIAIHDDENTAVAAFHSWTAELNINLLELHQSGERYLKYQEGRKIFYFDPNQMFTEVGIEKSIKKNNSKAPKELLSSIKSFADSLLQYFVDSSKRHYTIAIHNNSEESFSIETYKNSKNTAIIYIAKGEDVDDFFIVTDPSDFEYFKNLNQNVVLQSEQAEDDGSLSIYCQKNGIPYINIEAQDGHLQKQIEMIKLTYNLVSEKKR